MWKKKVPTDSKVWMGSPYSQSIFLIGLIYLTQKNKNPPSTHLEVTAELDEVVDVVPSEPKQTKH